MICIFSEIEIKFEAVDNMFSVCQSTIIIAEETVTNPNDVNVISKEETKQKDYLR